MIDQARLRAIMAQAGAIAMARWPGSGEHANALDVWEKSPNNPVCSADLAVDAFLREELSRLLPSAGWLSEETADSLAQRDGSLIWLVDPIDGTRDYIHGRPGWSVSVALVSAGRPLIGMLAAPARDEFWEARAGQGAWLNGAPISASRREDLPGARVPATMLPPEDTDLTMVDQPNSIALRIAMVADNRADLVATLRWGFEWDIGAATLIAREAGAIVSDAFGQTLGYNKADPRAFGLVVSAPAIHQAAVERLAERAQRLA
ncbi:MAG: 3'(2'),5'-bisphosphate nucleotidase CysQ [Sphingomonadales bacterium]|nr:3'(2'),5'-bisphosphate nucleotidase CysQ [Sphingomonadales bacterium]MDE2170053.1 3'(2'),5'-bisphosphate nucleotidase CysQ [Sphingomonadales bacterium]